MPAALSGEMVTPAADQYSLATIAYFLMTGSLPYLAKTPREMFTQLLSQPPIPLNRARPNLTFGQKVETVLMKGLSRPPADRYPTVMAFANELHAALMAPPDESAGIFSKVKSIFRR